MGLEWLKQHCLFNESHCLCYSSWTANPCRHNIRMHSDFCKRQAGVCGPYAAEGPRPHCDITLCPDIVLVCKQTKQIVLLKMTVTLKDPLEEAFKRKLSKYIGLVSDCHQAGCKARCFPVEVVCRGFTGHLLGRALKYMCIEEDKKRGAICSITEEIEKVSR